MSHRERRNAVSRERYRVACLVACLGATAAVASCGRDAAPPASAPAAAKVTAAVPEGALTTITLTAEAQKRLGIESAPVEQRTIARSRSVGGEIVPAGGAQITVTAPVAGTLGVESRVPAVGSHVEKGQIVLTLVPLAPAERDARIEAERAVAEAVGRQEMAAKRAERARQLARDGSGSLRAAEEAQADLAVADAALKAARDRLALVARGVTPSGAIPLAAPNAAVLRVLHATPGQTVSAGAPLFDLVDLETVWLRVPLYAGDVDTIDRRAPAEVVPLGSPSTVRGVAAVPIAAPPTADAIDRRRRPLLQPGQSRSNAAPWAARHRPVAAAHERGEPGRTGISGVVRRQRWDVGLRGARWRHLRPSARRPGRHGR